MRSRSRLTTILLIFLPLLAAFVVPLAPRSNAVKSADVKAASYASQKQWSLAAENWGIVLAVEGWRSDALEALGQAEFELKQFPQSILAFESARSTHELSDDNLIRLGKAYIQAGRQADAQKLWREISLSHPQDFSFLMEVADRQREIGDLVGTINTLLEAYALNPQDVHLNYLLGVHLSVAQPQRAVQYLTFVQSQLPSQPGVKDLLTELTNPGEEAIYRTLRVGQILSGMGEWDLAVHCFELVVQTVPENAYAWALLGEAKQHFDGSGLAELKKALQVDPKSDTANALMALYYRRQNKPDLALPFLQAAVKAAPQEVSWQIELGNTLAETGDLQTALVTLQGATTAAPDNPLTWKALAEFCFTRNIEITPTGLEAARKALALDPQNPQLMDLMGMGLMINGDLDSASRFIADAVAIDPANASFHLHYGQLFLQKKDCTQAVSQLRQASSLATDERIRSNAERLLANDCPGY
jgi:tetratricopeptide (TPR) repeat protein